MDHGSPEASTRPNHADDDDFEPWPERLALLYEVAAEAAERLGREVTGPHALGYQGGSIGFRTTAGEWLQVRVTPLQDDDYLAVRERIRMADRILPASILRPREIDSVVFAHGDDSVYATVDTLAPGWACSRYPCLQVDDPAITDAYVGALRGVLDGLARIQQAPPHSQTLHARFGRWVREECHVRADVHVDRLVTGHGDFHWGNFRLPEAHVVDWEFWGKVPEGYDAAQLLVMSLAVPRVATLVRHHFGDLLDGDDARRCLALWCHVVLLSRKYEGSFGGLVPHVIEFMGAELDLEPSPRELGGPPWEE